MSALDAVLRDTLTSTYVDDAFYALLREDVAEWDAQGTPLTEDERATHEALLLHESWLLDRRRFEDWYGLYARECLYWVPAADPVADPTAADPRNRVAIACDDRRRLGDRIVWLRTGVAYSQLPPSHTAHLSSALSPQLHLPAALPPTVLAHGTGETAEFARQTRDFGAALQAQGFDVEVTALPRNHFDILDDLADPEGPLARAVLRLAGDRP